MLFSESNVLALDPHFILSSLSPSMRDTLLPSFMGISQSVRQSVILPRSLAHSASRLRLVIDYCDAATAAEAGKSNSDPG